MEGTGVSPGRCNCPDVLLLGPRETFQEQTQGTQGTPSLTLLAHWLSAICLLPRTNAESSAQTPEEPETPAVPATQDELSQGAQPLPTKDPPVLPGG